MKYAQLHNGVEIPMLGFGTWKIDDGKTVIDAVCQALEVGYRHIDTAAIYQNEEGVGTGISQSGVPRKEIFLVTKVWNDDQGYESTLRAFEASLKRLHVDYIDLYLIHWPKPLSRETWKAMEKLYREGLAKSIGVSNFHKHHLLDLLPHCEIKPMVNQVEFHPRLLQLDLLEFCREQGIQHEAWSPLIRGQILQIPLLQELAKKYQRTISQIVLRWEIQMQVVTIPKSVTPERIKENFEIFDFELTQDDVNKISSLDSGERTGPNPDNFNF